MTNIEVIKEINVYQSSQPQYLQFFDRLTGICYTLEQEVAKCQVEKNYQETNAYNVVKIAKGQQQNFVAVTA